LSTVWGRAGGRLRLGAGDDFGPGSDIGFLVVFRNNDAGPWMSKFQDLQDELGRKVDIVDRKGVETSPNYIIRRHILSNARPIYVEG